MKLLLVLLSLVSLDSFGQEIDTATNTNKPSLFNFNPLNVKRDPFAPPEVVIDKNKSPLEFYDLVQIELLAVMSGAGASQAMLALPNGETHIVQVGDKIGRNQGRVTKITGSEIIVKEIFKDGRGKDKINFSTLSIKI